MAGLTPQQFDPWCDGPKDGHFWTWSLFARNQPLSARLHSQPPQLPNKIQGLAGMSAGRAGDCLPVYTLWAPSCSSPQQEFSAGANAPLGSLQHGQLQLHSVPAMNPGYNTTMPAQQPHAPPAAATATLIAQVESAAKSHVKQVHQQQRQSSADSMQPVTGQQTTPNSLAPASHSMFNSTSHARGGCALTSGLNCAPSMPLTPTTLPAHTQSADMLGCTPEQPQQSLHMLPATAHGWCGGRQQQPPACPPTSSEQQLDSQAYQAQWGGAHDDEPLAATGCALPAFSSSPACVPASAHREAAAASSGTQYWAKHLESSPVPADLELQMIQAAYARFGPTVDRAQLEQFRAEFYQAIHARPGSHVGNPAMSQRPATTRPPPGSMAQPAAASVFDGAACQNHSPQLPAAPNCSEQMLLASEQVDGYSQWAGQAQTSRQAAEPCTTAYTIVGLADGKYVVQPVQKTPPAGQHVASESDQQQLTWLPSVVVQRPMASRSAAVHDVPQPAAAAAQQSLYAQEPQSQPAAARQSHLVQEAPQQHAVDSSWQTFPAQASAAQTSSYPCNNTWFQRSQAVRVAQPAGFNWGMLPPLVDTTAAPEQPHHPVTAATQRLDALATPQQHVSGAASADLQMVPAAPAGQRPNAFTMLQQGVAGDVGTDLHMVPSAAASQRLSQTIDLSVDSVVRQMFHRIQTLQGLPVSGVLPGLQYAGAAAAMLGPQPPQQPQAGPDLASPVKRKVKRARLVKDGTFTMIVYGADETLKWAKRVGQFTSTVRHVLGDRKLNFHWRGSVLDSVVGAFLTQNVSDALSSKAFMMLTATFPARPSPPAQAQQAQCGESAATAIQPADEVSAIAADQPAGPEPVEAADMDAGSHAANVGRMLSAPSSHCNEHDVGRQAPADCPADMTPPGCQADPCSTSQPTCNMLADRVEPGRGAVHGQDWETADGIDWEAVRRAAPEALADAIKCRGMQQKLTANIHNLLNLLSPPSHGNAVVEAPTSGSQAAQDGTQAASRAQQAQRPSAAPQVLTAGSNKCLATASAGEAQLRDHAGQQQGAAARSVPSMNVYAHTPAVNGAVPAALEAADPETSGPAPPQHSPAIAHDAQQGLETADPLSEQSASSALAMQLRSALTSSLGGREAEDAAVNLRPAGTAEPSSSSSLSGDVANTGPAAVLAVAAQQAASAHDMREGSNALLCIQARSDTVTGELSTPMTSSRPDVELRSAECSMIQRPLDCSYVSLGAPEEDLAGRQGAACKTPLQLPGSVTGPTTADPELPSARGPQDVPNAEAAVHPDKLMAQAVHAVSRGLVSLEWLRDPAVSADQAREYLMNIAGLGRKSVACILLLALRKKDFPVDTNVGRICARLGWLPIDSEAALEDLDEYAPEPEVHKYLHSRLMGFDVDTLYELHYQMITLGKVFCSKRSPNCSACPLQSMCEYAQSGGARLRLSPGSKPQGANQPHQGTQPAKDGPGDGGVEGSTATIAAQPVADLEDLGTDQRSTVDVSAATPYIAASRAHSENGRTMADARQSSCVVEVAGDLADAPPAADGADAGRHEPATMDAELVCDIAEQLLQPPSSSTSAMGQLSTGSGPTAVQRPAPADPATPAMAAEPTSEPAAQAGCQLQPLAGQEEEVVRVVEAGRHLQDVWDAADLVQDAMDAQAGAARLCIAALAVLALVPPASRPLPTDPGLQDSSAALPLRGVPAIPAAAVRRRFRELSVLVHPDKCTHASAEKAFAILRQAQTIVLEHISPASPPTDASANEMPLSEGGASLHMPGKQSRGLHLVKEAVELPLHLLPPGLQRLYGHCPDAYACLGLILDDAPDPPLAPSTPAKADIASLAAMPQVLLLHGEDSMGQQQAQLAQQAGTSGTSTPGMRRSEDLLQDGQAGRAEATSARLQDPGAARDAGADGEQRTGLRQAVAGLEGTCGAGMGQANSPADSPTAPTTPCRSPSGPERRTAATAWKDAYQDAPQDAAGLGRASSGSQCMTRCAVPSHAAESCAADQAGTQPLGSPAATQSTTMPGVMDSQEPSSSDAAATGETAGLVNDKQLGGSSPDVSGNASGRAEPQQATSNNAGDSQQGDTVGMLLLVPCRLALAGRFPLNGTYFQVNEFFLDHTSLANPLQVYAGLLADGLRKRHIYFGQSISSICRGMTQHEVAALFKDGRICVRAYQPASGAPLGLPPSLMPGAALPAVQKRAYNRVANPLSSPGKRPAAASKPLAASKAPPAGLMAPIPGVQVPANSSARQLFGLESSPVARPKAHKRSSGPKHKTQNVAGPQQGSSTADTSGMAAGSSKRSAPAVQEAEGGHKKKRMQYFTNIPASKRCGSCKTCLNPSMKKACLTRRAEMLEVLAAAEAAEAEAMGGNALATCSHPAADVQPAGAAEAVLEGLQADSRQAADVQPAGAAGSVLEGMQAGAGVVQLGALSQQVPAPARPQPAHQLLQVRTALPAWEVPEHVAAMRP